MKKIIFLLLALGISVFVLWKYVFNKEEKSDEPQPVALVVSQHSQEFNKSVMRMLDIYYNLAEAFVNWDTASVSMHSVSLGQAIDSLKLGEMKKDSAIYPTVESQWGILKAEIAGLIADEGLSAKRESLNMFSQQLFDLLRIIKYDAAKVYYHECPMALNNYESSAFWLSQDGSDKARRNPYLGLHDPEYGKGMLICGNTRDSISVQ